MSHNITYRNLYQEWLDALQGDSFDTPRFMEIWDAYHQRQMKKQRQLECWAEADAQWQMDINTARAQVELEFELLTKKQVWAKWIETFKLSSEMNPAEIYKQFTKERMENDFIRLRMDKVSSVQTRAKELYRQRYGASE